MLLYIWYCIFVIVYLLLYICYCTFVIVYLLLYSPIVTLRSMSRRMCFLEYDLLTGNGDYKTSLLNALLMNYFTLQGIVDSDTTKLGAFMSLDK